MKKSHRFLASLLTLALVSACGDPDDSAALSDPVTEITVTGDDRMRFAPTAFTVRAGEEITLTFDNIGRMPKESMGHNLVVLTKDANANTFGISGARHPQNEYIDPQYEHWVIATTRILGPGEEEVLVFTAPSEPGEYPFVCSFPGHTAAGMKGVMTVIP